MYRLFSYVVLLAVLTWYAAYFLQPISLVSLDLGRHLTNGKIWWQQGLIIDTNHYSFVTPDFPVVNHHWGYGVWVYGVWYLGGFAGVALSNWLIHLLGICILWWWLKRSLGTWPAILIIWWVSPLIGSRIDARPESVSFLFFVLTWIGLEWGWQQSGTDKKIIALRDCLVLAAVFLLQMVWVNVHLFFFLGPIIWWWYCGWSWLVGRGDRRWWLMGSTVATVGSFFTPFGWQGILQPLTIFSNYEYRIAENQSLWFLYQYLGDTQMILLLGVYVAALLTIVGVLFVKKNWRLLRLALPLIVWCVAAILMLRLVALGAVALLLAIVWVYQQVSENLKQNESDAPNPIFISFSTLAGLFISCFTLAYGPSLTTVAVGLHDLAPRAGEFLQAHPFQGTLFNNYDSGGYLIYYLYETHSRPVFTDNRPEAYPTGFFPEYIQVQENADGWQKALDKYEFGAIAFYWRDLTPWAQEFLRDRLSDPEWALVWADEWMVILYRRTAENQAIIDQSEIHDSPFRGVEK